MTQTPCAQNSNHVARPGMRLCGPCGEKVSAGVRSFRTRAIAAGLCGSCGRVPPRPGCTDCTGCADKDKAYRRAHAAESAAYSAHRLRALRLEIVELLGGKCVRCGFSDERALQCDHIKGGGTKDRAARRGCRNKAILKSIRAGEGKYQLLCANCNWIKKVERNEKRSRRPINAQ